MLARISNEFQHWLSFPMRLNILVVDPDATALDEIKRKLESYQYKVLAFCHGDEALAAIANHHIIFHLALIEAVRDDKLLDALNHFPVIAMSNSEDMATAMQYIALGAQEFLHKPLSDAKLKNLWQHVVRKVSSTGYPLLPEPLRLIKSYVESMLKPSTFEKLRPLLKSVGEVESMVKQEEPSTPRAEESGGLSSLVKTIKICTKDADGDVLPVGEEGGLVTELKREPEEEVLHSSLGSPISSMVNYVRCENACIDSVDLISPRNTGTLETHSSLGSPISSMFNNVKCKNACIDLVDQISPRNADTLETHSSLGSPISSMANTFQFKDAHIDSFDQISPRNVGTLETHSSLGSPISSMVNNVTCKNACIDSVDRISPRNVDTLKMDCCTTDSGNCHFNSYNGTVDVDFDEEVCDSTVGEDQASLQSEVGGSILKGSVGSEIVNDCREEDAKKKNKKSTTAMENETTKCQTASSKKKIKVGWTPDLHRRFVQAVELLGVDQAIPSKILEVMKVDGLTRHNIASHLQKYRSHRKHLLARAAEAGSWHHYKARDSIGFRHDEKPPMHQNHPTRIHPRPQLLPLIQPYPAFPQPAVMLPLHVWGYPSVSHSFMPMWQQPLNMEPSHMPSPVAVAEFQSQSLALGSDEVDSCDNKRKDLVNAAIQEVLNNPSTPLPLGLKPPSMESVMAELQCQGITPIPLQNMSINL